MKKIITLGLFFSIGISALAIQAKPQVNKLSEKKIVLDDSTAGIHFFKGNWAEALAEAKRTDKLIFLDAYASWCGPCKIMAQNTFTDSRVGEYFNENFVNYKMDMEKNPEGPRLSRKLQLEAYPSLYFIDMNEKLVHSDIGMKGSKELINLGSSALLK
jgi:thioredoxin 1